MPSSIGADSRRNAVAPRECDHGAGSVGLWNTIIAFDGHGRRSLAFAPTSFKVSARDDTSHVEGT
jgi:hypothetical protein